MAEWIKRFSLAGKTALVTGATKGIGFETCKVLADAGADIAAVGRDRAGLAEVAAAVKSLGRKCFAIEADLASADGPVSGGAGGAEGIRQPSIFWSTMPGLPSSRRCSNSLSRIGTRRWR